MSTCDTRRRTAQRFIWTKESVIARDAGIAAETLSRVLNERHGRPSFDTIVRIAHAAKENVGYLIGERALSTYDEAQLLLALHDLRDAADRAIHLLEGRVDDDALHPHRARTIIAPRIAGVIADRLECRSRISRTT